MRYIVTYNTYNKPLDMYHDITKTFNKMVDVVEFMAKFDKLKEWESITIAAEK